MADITAIILTKNEEKKLTACINSIKDIVCRIVVIDSYSEDRTVEIANQLGAEVYQHPFKTHSTQFKYGLEIAQIKTKWVFRIDADERMTKESAEELEQLCEINDKTDINGIIVRFKVNFMGRELYHGGVYPFRKLLIFKYGKGNIEDRNMDEHIVLFEGKSIEMKNDSIHDEYKNLTFWISKHNWYSSKEALDYLEHSDREHDMMSGKLEAKAKIKRYIKFKIYYKLPMGLRAKLFYYFRYYIKFGFLDGKEGKIYAFLQAYWYRFLVDAKIYEAKKTGKDLSNIGDLKL